MQLKKLHLQGFTSYIDSEIEFKNNVISTIVAPNGYGKSSILEAITTALFFKARGVDNKGSGMENLINNTCNEFIITLDFAMNGVDYRIVRKKSKSKHELDLYINDILQSEKIADTQKKIYDIIKMDYETFLDTVCIGQGKSGNFMSKPANERKEVFANILNLSQYEVYEKKAKEEKKVKNTSLQQVNTKIELIQSKCEDEEDLQTQLNEYKQKDLQPQIQDAKHKYEQEKERKIQYETLKSQQDKLLSRKANIENTIISIKKQLNALHSDYDNNTNQQATYNDKLQALKNQVINIPTIDIDIDDLNAQKTNIQKSIQDNKQKIAELQTTNNINRTQINDLKQQYSHLKNYGEGVCQFCGNVITEQHKEQHLQDLFAQAKKLSNDNKERDKKIENVNSQINNLQGQLDIINNQINNYNSQVKEIQKLQLAKQKQDSDIELYKSKLNNLQTAINNIKQQKSSLDEQLQDLKNELNDYIDIKPIETQSFNDTYLESVYNDLLQQQKDIEAQMLILQNKINDIQALKSDLTDLKQQKKDLETQIQDYDSVIQAFSKKGIQADMIANVLPDIENEVNKVLQILFNNAINIEFVTQKENKTGNTLETLEIVIHDNNVDRKYETYSGGEKFRIDFAFHIGLSKFLGKRANSNIEFFMIDEGLGSQDDEGKDNFIQIVNQIKSMFKQIFIITHIEEIKDVFDNKITITKDLIKGSIIQ